MKKDIRSVLWKNTTDHSYDQFKQMEKAFRCFMNVYVNTTLSFLFKKENFFHWPAMDSWDSPASFIARTIKYAKPPDDPIYGLELEAIKQELEDST